MDFRKIIDTLDTISESSDYEFSLSEDDQSRVLASMQSGQSVGLTFEQMQDFVEAKDKMTYLRSAAKPDDSTAVIFEITPLFVETEGVHRKHLKQMKTTYAAFIAHKRQDPMAPFGGKDRAFTGNGPLHGILHAGMTHDISLLYSKSGKNPTKITLYGFFSHDELGTGNPPKPNKQKSIRDKVDRQPVVGTFESYEYQEEQPMRVTEVEKSTADFKYEKGKVTATLKSYDSMVYTKLAQKVERMTQLQQEITELEKDVKSEARGLVADLFSAEEETKTRVIDTVSFIISLAKKSEPTTTYKYAAILEDLEKKLTPELIKVLENLKAQYSSTVQKEPALTIKSKKVEEAIGDKFKDEIASYFKKYRAFIGEWAKRYDSRLAKLKQQAKTA